MNTAFYRDLLRQHGAGALVFHLAYRAANRVLDLRVWNSLVITMDTIDSRILAESRNAGVRMLEASAMERYADDPEYDLTRRTLTLDSDFDAFGDRRQAVGGLGLLTDDDFFLILDGLKACRLDAHLVLARGQLAELPLAGFVGNYLTK